LQAQPVVALLITFCGSGDSPKYQSYFDEQQL
jgi:hypothetical protein